jgi:superoxide reductase
MALQNQIYKCNICGNVVEVLHPGNGQLVCCGKPMDLLIEKNEDIGKEKHVPIVEETEKGIKVKVGLIPHPMEENHYIEWIEIMNSGAGCRKYLKSGDLPESFFESAGDNVKARAYCNIHGLWQSVKII